MRTFIKGYYTNSASLGKLLFMKVICIYHPAPINLNVNPDTEVKNNTVPVRLGPKTLNTILTYCPAYDLM